MLRSLEFHVKQSNFRKFIFVIGIIILGFHCTNFYGYRLYHWHWYHSLDVLITLRWLILQSYNSMTRLLDIVLLVPPILVSNWTGFYCFGLGRGWYHSLRFAIKVLTATVRLAGFISALGNCSHVLLIP